MLFVYSSRPSHGARALARALRGRRARNCNDISTADTVINWGDSSCPAVPKTLLNKREAVALASNKLLTFDALKEAGVPIPEYARTRDGVSWHGVSATVVRHLLQGSSGEGIEIIEKGEELPNARLYVRYEPRKDEYRVHVIGGEVILVQRKARRLDVPDSEVNWRVRNHSNGFIFQRSGVQPSPAVTQAAIDAIRHTGLDFGAVDIIEKKSGQALVLEINTAPGLEGSTIEDYARGFKKSLGLTREVPQSAWKVYKSRAIDEDQGARAETRH